MTSAMSVSVGIAGVGAFGYGFIDLFKRHPLVKRVALCDLIPERLAERAAEFKIEETYPCLDEMLGSNLDAIAIITQHWLHAPQAIQALKAGKHVYSAVPIISLPDGDEMLDWCDKLVRTSRETGLFYMMGETSYYRPEAMFCRRQAADGKFGRFIHASGAYFHDVDLPACSLRDVAQARLREKWDRSKAGDPPMHYPTHSLGGFLSVTGGCVTELSALGTRDPADDWHRQDTVSGNVFGDEIALMRLSCGATAQIQEYRWIGAVGYEGFSLYGAKGSLVDSFEHVRWMDKEGVSAPLSPEKMRDPLPPKVAKAYADKKGQIMLGGHGGSHAYLVHEFVEAVAARRQPAVNAWVAARMFAPGVIAHKSALKGGALLKVPDWGEPPGA